MQNNKIYQVCITMVRCAFGRVMEDLAIVRVKCESSKLCHSLVDQNDKLRGFEANQNRQDYFLEKIVKKPDFKLINPNRHFRPKWPAPAFWPCWVAWAAQDVLDLLV